MSSTRTCQQRRPVLCWQTVFASRPYAFNLYDANASALMPRATFLEMAAHSTQATHAPCVPRAALRAAEQHGVRMGNSRIWQVYLFIVRAALACCLWIEVTAKAVKKRLGWNGVAIFLFSHGWRRLCMMCSVTSNHLMLKVTRLENCISKPCMVGSEKCFQCRRRSGTLLCGLGHPRFHSHHSPILRHSHTVIVVIGSCGKHSKLDFKCKNFGYLWV